MKVGINPTGHIVLVLPEEVEVKSKAGIILTTASQTQRESMAQTEATVIALGNTAYLDQDFPGARQAIGYSFSKYAGTMCQGQDGKTYRLINDLDVKAILDPVEGDSNA